MKHCPRCGFPMTVKPVYKRCPICGAKIAAVAPTEEQVE
jgi:rubrerythrin